MIDVSNDVAQIQSRTAAAIQADPSIDALLAVIAWYILARTQAGNWIYSTGGNLAAAKANGVPTNKVKISLFMFSAFCATMFAATQVFETNTADAAKGNLKELEAIAAAVIGAVVLTGGFGPFGWLKMQEMNRIAQEEMARIGITISDPEQSVGTMSGGQRQTLAIAVILITHNEIHAQLIADRFTFLSLGEVIGSGTNEDLAHDDIKRLMAGCAEIGDLAAELAA